MSTPKIMKSKITREKLLSCLLAMAEQKTTSLAYMQGYLCRCEDSTDDAELEAAFMAVMGGDVASSDGRHDNKGGNNG